MEKKKTKKKERWARYVTFELDHGETVKAESFVLRRVLPAWALDSCGAGELVIIDLNTEVVHCQDVSFRMGVSLLCDEKK